MLQNKINKIVPYINENFISYPLQEEGKYIPFISFWQKAETVAACKKLDARLRKLDTKTGYSISIEGKQHRSVIHNISIYPKFRELKNGSYKYSKSDWSIEEMIDMIIKFLED